MSSAAQTPPDFCFSRWRPWGRANPRVPGAEPAWGPRAGPLGERSCRWDARGGRSLPTPRRLRAGTPSPGSPGGSWCHSARPRARGTARLLQPCPRPDVSGQFYEKCQISNSFPFLRLSTVFIPSVGSLCISQSWSLLPTL